MLVVRSRQPRQYTVSIYGTVPHLLLSRTASTTTSFLLFTGFSTLSTDGETDSGGPRAPVPDGLRWTRGEDSDHDFATPRFNGDCDMAWDGSLSFIAPGTGKRPDVLLSVAPELPVSGEICVPAINCRTLPVLKRFDQDPRDGGVFVVTLILRAPGGSCAWYQLWEVDNDRPSFRQLGRVESGLAELFAA